MAAPASVDAFAVMLPTDLEPLQFTCGKAVYQLCSLQKELASLTQDSAYKAMLLTIDSLVREAQSVRFMPVGKGKLSLAMLTLNTWLLEVGSARADSDSIKSAGVIRLRRVAHDAFAHECLLFGDIAVRDEAKTLRTILRDAWRTGTGITLGHGVQSRPLNWHHQLYARAMSQNGATQTDPFVQAPVVPTA